jgi:O-antigen ligase
LFVTYRRTSYLAVGASLLILYAFFPRFRRVFLPLLVVIGFVAWLYTDEIGDSAVVRERIGQRADTFNGRTDLWDTALLYAQREPGTGYGNGGFLYRSGLTAIESHYLWLLVDGGLLALIPFVLVFLRLITTGLQLYRARGVGILAEPDLIGVFFATLGAYLVNLSTAVINHDFPHVVLFLLAGAVIGSHEALLARTAPAPVLPGMSAATHR